MESSKQQNRIKSTSESVQAAALPQKAIICYAFPILALAFAGLPLYIHAPDYFATEFNLSLSTLGMILLALRLIDAIQDPIFGRLSDLWHSKRVMIFYFASAVLVLSFIALFQPAAMGIESDFAIIVWFTLSIFIATSMYSILTINLNTLGGLWSKDSHQKTRIATTRELLGLVGLLIAVILPSILKNFISARDAFLLLGVILAVLIGICLLVFQRWQLQYFSTIEVDLDQRSEASIKKLFSIEAFLSLAKETRLFFLVYWVSLFASSIPAVLVLFFIRDLLNAEHLSGLFLLIYFLSSAIFMPVWSAMSKKYGKFQAWKISMALAVLVFIWAFFLDSGDIWQYGLICMLSGFAFGADLALPASILADQIQTEQKGKQASFYFGVLSFLAKLALALASLLSFSLLDWVGFQAGQTNDNQALWMLSFCYALVPCLIKIIAIQLVSTLNPIKAIKKVKQ